MVGNHVLPRGTITTWTAMPIKLNLATRVVVSFLKMHNTILRSLLHMTSLTLHILCQHGEVVEVQRRTCTYQEQ